MGPRGPRDPRKTIGLIGRACKGRNVLSEAVLTVECLVTPTRVRPLAEPGPAVAPREHTKVRDDSCFSSIQTGSRRETAPKDR